MRTSALLYAVAVAAAAFAGPADAVYKCTTAKGTVYQDRPCREGNETDVSIVIPTGELAPKNRSTPSEGTLAKGARGESRDDTPKSPWAAGDDSVSVTKPTDQKANDQLARAAENARKKDAARSAENQRVARDAEQAGKTEARDSRSGAENNVVPLTAEEARKMDPSAKYFSTEAFGAGNDTPARMNCESSTGERRVFYLSNGKLTSI